MNDPLEPIEFATIKAALGGISEKTLERMIDAGKFPAPFMISGRTKVWYRRDLEWYIWGQSVKSRLRSKPRTLAGHSPDIRGHSAPEAEKPAKRG